MTHKQQLAWCYLNAAIAACGPGASSAAINRSLARFSELTDFRFGVVEVDPFDTVARGTSMLLGVAEMFAKECAKEDAGARG